MLIKFDVTEEEAGRMKLQYGQNVASKAFKLAALDAIDLNRTVEDQRQVIDDLRIEIRRLQSIIESARAAAAHLLDKASQKDMLNV